MNFVSLCEIYQDIDATLPLKKKKKEKVTERETDRQTDRLNEVPGGRHKSERVKGSSP
jgi:hypothetical protein